MSSITFSVIIPAWNAVDTISASIDSVLAQTTAPHEIIVVDDGSADATSALVKGRYKKHVLLITLPENAGPSAARNAGLDAATGSHVCFLDSDDVWHPQKLAVTEGVIRDKPGAALWYHWYTSQHFETHAFESVSLSVLTFPRLIISNPIATPCVILPNTSLRFDDAMRYTEDHDYFLRAAWKGEVVFFDAVLTKLGRPIMASGGQSSNQWKMRRGEWKTYLHLVKLSSLFILLLPVLWFWSLLKHLRLRKRSWRA